ncbi:hypothetical protein [Bombella saccharophila]|uniref:Uncharacterized protein n=1 Tax=Bombella saccharophila TaxID=2967338 RepID=A0ABT3W513_9PROT|nr:hypothetical protein [Bombella saccharophila]MCX5613936.1 hypothetical protein [Bombella saccharophila]
MITLLILLPLWGFIGLCYLNSLPPHRRQNPCHLPRSTPWQRSCYIAGPFIALALSYRLAGLDGLFLWGFSAPLMGIVLGITLPYWPKKHVQKEALSDHYLQK